MEKFTWKETNRKSLFNEYGRGIEKVSFVLPSQKKVVYYLFTEKFPSCLTLGITPDNKIITVKQFRPGQKRVLLELPGGTMEQGETPLETAKREMLEETGFSGNFKFLLKYNKHAYSTIYRYGFVAINCKKIAQPNPDNEETGQTSLLSVREFKKHIHKGDITELGIAYAGLDFLGLL